MVLFAFEKIYPLRTKQVVYMCKTKASTASSATAMMMGLLYCQQHLVTCTCTIYFVDRKAPKFWQFQVFLT